MLRAGPALAAVLLSSACEAPPSEPVSDEDRLGYWTGSFQVLRDTVQVVVNITGAPDDANRFIGEVALPRQGIFQVPTAPEWDEDELRFEVQALGGRYEGRLNRDRSAIRGDWFQAGGVFRLTLSPTDEPPRPARPQEPEAPFPYRVDTVSIPHSDGRVVLAGTLTTPMDDGPHPAVVLVSGSGPQDRDETLFRHKPFLVLADHLTRHGIAVLRYDDRGIAESVGDFANATTEDFATDALVAVEFLVAREGIDPDRIGIIGHSEGGIVAPIAAARSDRVAFIVSLAGTGISGRELVELQTRRIMEVSGVSPPVMALNTRIQDEVLDNLMAAANAETALEAAKAKLEEAWGGLPMKAVTALGLASHVDRAMEEMVRQVASPWMFFFLEFDPTTAFERVRVPVLALNGSLDLQVPPDPNLYRIREALERGGNNNVTAIELDGLNHLFQRAGTGLPSEYGNIQETMAPEVLRIIADWINALATQGSREEVRR